MLTYYHALISHPCARTVDELLDYVQAHPGCIVHSSPGVFVRHASRHRNRVGRRAGIRGAQARR